MSQSSMPQGCIATWVVFSLQYSAFYKYLWRTRYRVDPLGRKPDLASVGVIWCKYRHPLESNEPISKACKKPQRTRLALCIQVALLPLSTEGNWRQVAQSGGISAGKNIFFMYNGPLGWRTACSRLSPMQPGQMSSIAPQEWWSFVDFTALSPLFFYYLASMWQLQQRPRSWNVIKVKRMSSMCCWPINDWPWKSTFLNQGKGSASGYGMWKLQHLKSSDRTITATDQSQKAKLALLNCY